MSRDSMLKNIKHHPELGLDEYRHLPDLGRKPQLVIRTREKTVVVIRQQGRWYMAAVKATGDGNELFVTSFWVTNSKDIATMKKSGEVLFEEK